MTYFPKFPAEIYEAGLMLVLDATKGEKFAVREAIQSIYRMGLREGATNPDVQKGYADEEAACVAERIAKEAKEQADLARWRERLTERA